VLIGDDDIANVRIKALTSPIISNQVSIPEGGVPTPLTAISLNTQPVENVDVTITPNADVDIGAGNGQTRIFSFTPDNWESLQQLNVRAADDGVATTERTAKISISINTSDPVYSYVIVLPITLKIADSGFIGTAPVANADSFSLNEDSVSFSLDVLANDTDDGYPELPGSLSLTGIATTPLHGTATVSNGKILYTPSANYNGADTLQYFVSDGSQSSTGTVSLTVTNLNDLPTANAQQLIGTEDTPLSVQLAGADIDPSDAITFQIAANPNYGVLSGTGSTRVYTPQANFNGYDSFQFTTTDLAGTVSQLATVTVFMHYVNDAPTLSGTAIPLTIAEDTPTVLNFLGTNDVDLDPTLNLDPAMPAESLSVSVTSVSSGDTVGTPSGLTATYTPRLNWNTLISSSARSVVYKAKDAVGLLSSTTRNFSITLTSVQDGSPTGSLLDNSLGTLLSLSLNEDSSLSFYIKAFDTSDEISGTTIMAENIVRFLTQIHRMEVSF
jgi:hypothetical protein